MANLEREIAGKRRQIATHEEDLGTLYRELGQLALQSEDDRPGGLLGEQRLRYREAQQRWQEAEHSHRQIAGYISRIEDRSRKISQIEADIKSLSGEQDAVHAQLGAIAWEMYGFGLLSERTRQLCQPIFSAQAQKMQSLADRAAAQRGTLLRRIALSRLHRLRSSLDLPLLKAGRAIAAQGWQEDLTFERAPTLLEALTSVQKRAEELAEELDLHKSAMAKLKSEGLSGAKEKLAQSEERAKAAKVACDGQAREYGRLLCEQTTAIPPSWQSLIRQITLHKNRIQMLQQEIRQLGNEIKAEELEGQIEVERRRIAHLRASMESAHRQIVALDASIADKERRIEVLRSAGEEPRDG